LKASIKIGRTWPGPYLQIIVDVIACNIQLFDKKYFIVLCDCCIYCKDFAVLHSRFQILHPLQYSCGHTIVLSVTLENMHKVRCNIDPGEKIIKAAGRPVAGFLNFGALNSD
jgi:hypothetical protein